MLAYHVMGAGWELAGSWLGAGWELAGRLMIYRLFREATGRVFTMAGELDTVAEIQLTLRFDMAQAEDILRKLLLAYGRTQLDDIIRRLDKEAGKPPATTSVDCRAAAPTQS
jgi:hypothetical protein